MTEINLKNLDALISKAQELKKLLTETPEILSYLQLLKELDAEKLSLPKVDDVLLKSSEAAEILGVNKSSISQFVKAGQLRGYIVAGLRFWRSEVKALAKLAEKE